MNNFLDELVNRLNKQLKIAINNDCNVDRWIKDKLRFNKYIVFKNGKFEVK